MKASKTIKSVPTAKDVRRNRKTSFCGTGGRDGEPWGPKGPMGPGVGWVGWGGWGGARGERAMSKPQGDHIREATTARCLKTGGHTTVQGRRVAGVAVMN
jgi:hypothetical protein